MKELLYHLFCKISVGALAVLGDPIAEGLRAARPPMKSHLVYHVMLVVEVAVFILQKERKMYTFSVIII